MVNVKVKQKQKPRASESHGVPKNHNGRLRIGSQMSLKEIDPQTIAVASKYITKMRRLYYICAAAFAALFVFAYLLFTNHQLRMWFSPSIHRLAIFVVFFLLYSSWTIGFISMFCLWRFRCPRCTKRSREPGLIGLPYKICHQCGLKLE